MLSKLSLLFKKIKAHIMTPNFECKQCGTCCTKYVICVTHKDVLRVVKYTGLNPHKFLNCMIPEKNAEESFSGVPRFIGEDGKQWILCFKENEKTGGCCFNNSGPCSIYPARPYVCHAFPFLWRRKGNGYEFLFNMDALEFCRGVWAKENKFDFEAVAKDMMESEKEDREYAKIVEEWNELVKRKEVESPSLKTFIDFIMKKASDEGN
ncbi:MAG: YkgJ family cysteine cluster protein [Candidatus Jordarchaeaceae archaeon]